MPQIVNTNIASLNAQRNLNSSQRANETALQRLSSGLRINSAKDDAAGLAISTRFESQIRGTNVAVRNAGDAISLAQTAEGALDSIATNLQRIRELALQSANDTNSDVDRVALNEEVDQLKAEIENISNTTNFNGKKLLDGSFQNATFQTGANVGDTISFGINSARSDQLGTAVEAGISSTPDIQLSSFLSDGTNNHNLASGDLVINGVAVGASSGADDDASVYDKSSSAIAKAEAINKVSDESGVTAVVNENVVAGTTVAASVDVALGTVLTINNVAIQVSSDAAKSVEANLTGVVDAINEKSAQTGVVASFDPDSSSVTLTAEDGRNITILEATAGDAAKLGLGAGAATNNGQTYTGSFTLVSDDGSDIKIGTNTGNIDNAGLEIGTFSGSNGGAVGDNVSGTALVTGDLVVNGVAVGPSLASSDTASTTGNAASAIAVAAAINSVSGESGVTAQVNQNVVVSGAVSGTAGGATINGVAVTVTFNAGDDVGTKQSLTVDAFNAVSGQTGVRAEAFGSDKFLLIADDGRNITIASPGAGSGLTAATNYGSVSLVSAGQIDLSSNTGNSANAGFKAGTYGGGETGTLLKDIDISTVKGAEAAVKAVDNALADIASQQAELGAIQNRFDLTISNLEVRSENLTAANSRIRDADFAAETAELSRTQVLQQAGISVLAQANARPQQVLSLLQ